MLVYCILIAMYDVYVKYIEIKFNLKGDLELGKFEPHQFCTLHTHLN